MRILMRVGVGVVLLCSVIAAFVISGTEDVKPTASTAMAIRTGAQDHARASAAGDLVVRRVLVGSNLGQSSRVSPDGRWLSYAEWGGAEGAIVLRDLRTGERRVFEGGNPVSTTVSPDGARIAAPWGPGDVRIIELRTGETQRIPLADDAWPGLDFLHLTRAWTPDGQDLVVLIRDDDNPPTMHLGLLNVETGSLDELKSFGPMHHEPRIVNVAVSPDGGWIAYTQPREGDPDNVDIGLVSRDGTRDVPIAVSDARERVVGWLPGGGPLLYLSTDGRISRLLAQWLDEGRPVGEPQVVRSDLASQGPLGVQPLGTFDDGLVYGLYADPVHTAWTGTVDPETGAVITAPVPVRGADAQVRSAAWSADGENLVYLMNAGGYRGWELVKHSVRTGAEHRIPFPLVPSGGPLLISPNGDELVLYSDAPRGTFRLRITAGEAEVMEGLEEGQDCFSWTPDGAGLMCAPELAERGRRIVVRDLESGDVRELLELNGSEGSGAGRITILGPTGGSLALSPDGSELAYVRMESGPGTRWARRLMIADLATGERREVWAWTASDPEDRYPTLSPKAIHWTADGERLVFRATSGDLRVVPRLGGDERVIDVGHDTFRFVGIHPDGRRIAFLSSGPNGSEAGSGRYEVWMMENLRAVVGLETRDGRLR